MSASSSDTEVSGGGLPSRTGSNAGSLKSDESCRTGAESGAEVGGRGKGRGEAGAGAGAEPEVTGRDHGGMDGRGTAGRGCKGWGAGLVEHGQRKTEGSV